MTENMQFTLTLVGYLLMLIACAPGVMWLDKKYFNGNLL